MCFELRFHIGNDDSGSFKDNGAEWLMIASDRLQDNRHSAFH